MCSRAISEAMRPTGQTIAARIADIPGPLVARPHRHGGVYSLNVGLVDEYFSSLGAEGLYFALFQIFAAFQLLNLAIQVRHDG